LEKNEIGDFMIPLRTNKNTNSIPKVFAATKLA